MIYSLLTMEIKAQEKQVLYFGYENLNEVLVIGGLDGTRILYYGFEAASDFDKRYTFKILGYIPYTFYETDHSSYVISIGGGMGYKFGEKSRDGNFNEGILYEGGVNIFLSKVMLGYSYGFDEYLQSYYNTFKIGIRRNHISNIRDKPFFGIE